MLKVLVWMVPYQSLITKVNNSDQVPQRHKSTSVTQPFSSKKKKIHQPYYNVLFSEVFEDPNDSKLRSANKS